MTHIFNFHFSLLISPRISPLFTIPLSDVIWLLHASLLSKIETFLFGKIMHSCLHFYSAVHFQKFHCWVLIILKPELRGHFTGKFAINRTHTYNSTRGERGKRPKNSVSLLFPSKKRRGIIFASQESASQSGVLSESGEQVSSVV